MIEFDVLPARGDGRLVLAHDYEDLDRRAALTLEQGLQHLASSPFAAVELDVDLKLPGYELEVLAALRAHGLLERALISTQYRESLAVIRAAEPSAAARLVGAQAASGPVPQPADVDPRHGGRAGLAGAAALWAARPSPRGECNALMSHWRLVTPALVRAVDRGGGELYVWTVDDAAADPRPGAARRHGRHHQRPAPVRGSHRASVDPAGGGAVMRRAAEVRAGVAGGGRARRGPEQLVRSAAR